MKSVKSRFYPWLALVALLLSMLACDGGNGLNDLDATRQFRAWCGQSVADACVNP